MIAPLNPDGGTNGSTLRSWTAERYGMPYHVGTQLPDVQRRGLQREAPTSWDVDFEATTRRTGVEGVDPAYDGAIFIADAAIYLMAHHPELGIDDPYELTQ